MVCVEEIHTATQKRQLPATKAVAKLIILVSVFSAFSFVALHDYGDHDNSHVDASASDYGMALDQD